MLYSRTVAVLIALISSSLVATFALAAESNMEGHISIVPSEIKWNDAPSIGLGAKIAVLEGNLKEAVPFTMRIKLPPNFKVPAHTHPVFERVTVISGVFNLGIGEKFDSATAKAYPAGSVTMMPPGMPMFAFVGNEETVFQLHGTGPWGINYVNSADDPRNK